VPTWKISVALEAEGTTPEGFVPLDPAAPHTWIMEREVTCAEYLDFLNDPAVLPRVDVGPTVRLVPRSRPDATEGLWRKDASGRFVLPPGWAADWPVLSVTWDDATAYAEWRTARARPGERYALPTRHQWIYACSGWSPRNYPFGDRVHAKWVKCCFARKRAVPESVLRFPIDESPVGVFDVCGSVREWLDDWYDDARRMRRMGGGSWGTGDPELLKIWGIGEFATTISGENGFRLALTRERE
jgi:formylglycine-generating enzyme required for sulfatase activity